LAVGAVAKKSKLVSIDTAMAAVKDGSSILLGGLMLSNRPSALTREIVKRGIKGLTVISTPQAGYDVDLLIGGRSAAKAIVGYVGFEYLGMAYHFRRAAETGSCQIVPCDESILAGALMATIEGMPYHPVHSILGSDILKINPLVKKYRPPFGDKELVAVPAVNPDVALIHAQQADEAGNIRHLGGQFADLIVAKACKTVIVSVDEVVSHTNFTREPRETSIPAYLVDMVVELPGGAHPCESQGNYAVDEEHIREYVRIGRKAVKQDDRSEFDSYLQKFVYQPADNFDYIDRIGGYRRMFELRKKAVIG